MMMTMMTIVITKDGALPEEKMLVGQTHNAAPSLALSAAQRKSFPPSSGKDDQEGTRKKESGNGRVKNTRRRRRRRGLEGG